MVVEVFSASLAPFTVITLLMHERPAQVTVGHVILASSLLIGSQVGVDDEGVHGIEHGYLGVDDDQCKDEQVVQSQHHVQNHVVDLDDGGHDEDGVQYDDGDGDEEGEDLLYGGPAGVGVGFAVGSFPGLEWWSGFFLFLAKCHL
jgi:hypothetical protein